MANLLPSVGSNETKYNPPVGEKAGAFALFALLHELGGKTL